MRSRAWFAEAAFREIGFDIDDDAAFSIGTNRFEGDPAPFRANRRMFTFLGDGTDAHF